MARNEEKAQAMLNRWIRQKSELYQNDKQKTIPRSKKAIFGIQTINECERFRNSLLRDIGKKVTKIQNAGLGEKVIREINDEINKLLVQVRHFEERIADLGGANYKKIVKQELQQLEGSELPGFGGYKYFGAAKDLPGVRELFKKDVPEAPSKPIIEIYQNLDQDLYFGRKVENLEEMLKEENELEEKLREEELWNWASTHAEQINKKLKGRQQPPTKQEILDFMEEEAYYDINQILLRDREEKEMEEQENFRIQKLNERKKELLEQYFKE